MQRLLPQVQQLTENVLVKHIQRVHQETEKRVIMNEKCVFETVPLAGFENVFVVHGMPEEIKAVQRLKTRWTKDLKKRAEGSPVVHAAFKATYPAAATTTEPREPRAKRTTRTKQSMAEPAGPVAANPDPTHMSHLLPAGRLAHAARTSLPQSMRRKQRMTELTDAGVETIEEWSHAFFGDKYLAYQADAKGMERDLEVLVGKDCFEHLTPTAWRALGHPEIMRCHCVAVDQEYDGRPPRAAMDYSIFHSDFSVETFDFDTLADMQFVRLPELSITEDYQVLWRAAVMSANVVALKPEEYQGNFNDPRPKPLRRAPFWER